MRKYRISRLLVALFILGDLYSIVMAGEDRLMLPVQTGDYVRYLKSDQTNINPSDVLQVFVGDRGACCDGRKPMAGHYTLTERWVTFDPAFDFSEGQTYTVRTLDRHEDEGAMRGLSEFIINPLIPPVETRVLAISPGAKTIPENTLRFYIHFSTPMKPHVSSRFIHLIDNNGHRDSSAFMLFKQELWSEDRKRLTLLLDPGRIKRGIVQNERLGPALRSGLTYSLVVEKGWPNAKGTGSAPRFEKQFFVSSPLKTLPDVKNWRIVAPRLQSRDPLIIKFDRSFDSEGIQHAIALLNEAGISVPGKALVEDHSTLWRFVPVNKWKTKSVQVIVDARLEDLAGNNFRDLLEHSVGTSIQSVNQKTLTVALVPNTGS